MLSRWFSCVALFAVLVMPAAARAGDKEQPPTLRLQVRSLDAVLDNLKLLVSLSGREEIAKQVEGLIKTKIGNKGLEGIDPARPFGAYGRFGKELNDVSGVVLVPILDEKAFLGLLENLNVQFKKNENTGIYTIKTGQPVEVSFRFANKYAYFSALNLEALDPKTLLTPDRVFPANQQAAISATFRIDQLPEAVKFIAKAQFEQKIQEGQDQKIPGETPAQKAFRLAVAREIVEDVTAVFNDGEELSVDFNIDKNSKEMSATFSLTAQAKSELAKKIEAMNKGKNLFANVKSDGAAMQGSLTLALPKNLQKSFDNMIDEARTKILKDIRDETKKKQAEDLIKAVAPTFKAGELDAAISLKGPGKDKHYSVIAGIKIQQGEQVNQVFRELLDELLKQVPVSEKAKIKFDAETVAGTKVHRFDLGAHYDAKVRDLFGETPAFIAIREDAIFYSLGPDGLPMLKTALSSKASGTSNPMTLEFSLARLVPLMEKAPKEKIQELFPDGDQGTVRFTVAGGSALRVRLTTRLSVVQFLGAVANLQKGGE